MPEGDTIFRTASSLRRWIGGRTVTAAHSLLPAPNMATLVGTTCASVDAHGKHLLMRFTGAGPDLVLHTHMRMTGSWHVYSAGDTWKRPERQAKVVIECGERVAVCFNVPIVELTTDGTGLRARHDAVGHLGPDILSDPLDMNAIVSRVRSRPPETPLGELLLDQRVTAGIGNIYRCESLFVEGFNPWRRVHTIDDVQLSALITTAATLMRTAIVAHGMERDFGRGSGQPWVYGRTGRPCHRCAALIRSRLQGVQARTAFWCPTCQPTRYTIT